MGKEVAQRDKGIALLLVAITAWRPAGALPPDQLRWFHQDRGAL